MDLGFLNIHARIVYNLDGDCKLEDDLVDFENSPWEFR